jgi:hypothetical protein
MPETRETRIPIAWTLKTDRERAIFEAGYNSGRVVQQQKQQQFAKQAETCFFRLPSRTARCAALFPDDETQWCGPCLLEKFRPTVPTPRPEQEP